MTATNAACQIEPISGAIVEDDIVALLTVIGVTIGEINDTPPVQRTTQEFLTMLETTPRYSPISILIWTG